MGRLRFRKDFLSTRMGASLGGANTDYCAFSSGTADGAGRGEAWYSCQVRAPSIGCNQ